MDIDNSQENVPREVSAMLARAETALNKAGQGARLRVSGFEALLLADVLAAIDWIQRATNRIWLADTGATMLYDAPGSPYRLIHDVPPGSTPVVKLYGSNTALTVGTDYRLIQRDDGPAYYAILRVISGARALWTTGAANGALPDGAISVTAVFAAEASVPDEINAVWEARAVRDWRRRTFMQSGFGGASEDGESDVPLEDGDLLARLQPFWLPGPRQIASLGMDT